MKHIDWRSVPSMGEEHEQKKLEEWIKPLYQEMMGDLHILEIGHYFGQSTALLAQFGQVVTIDPHGALDGISGPNDSKIGTENLIEFLDNMRRLHLLDRVFPILSTSLALSCLGSRMFDVIFVDGGHSYEDVSKDFDQIMANDVLDADGILIVDDYKRPGFGYPPYNSDHPHHGPYDPWWGVAKATDELIAEGDFDIVEHYAGRLCLRRKPCLLSQ